MGNVTNEDKWRGEGYAWGVFIGSREWLTIAGSAYRSAPLTVRPEDAPEPNHATVMGGKPVLDVLARVERCGGSAFRVLEIVEERVPWS